MLVLGRRENERVFLRDRKSGAVTEIKICRLDPENCRIGITATHSVEVVREEVLTRAALANRRCWRGGDNGRD